MSVSVVPLADVDPIPLPGDSWSRMLVTGDRVPAPRARSATPSSRRGRSLAPVRHETEEVAYVVAGAGELRLDDGAGRRSARATRSTSPPGVWHAVANTGDEDVVMVFGFPHPDYPPTERA